MKTTFHSILHVPRRFVLSEWGGTETVVLEISRRQQQEGWTPQIFTSLAFSNCRSETIGGVPVRRFNYCYPFFGLSAEQRLAMDKKGGNLLSFSLFAALMREPGVRLFHAHALNRLGGEVRTAARLRGRPFVVSLHGGHFEIPASERESMAAPTRGRFEWGRLFGALLGSRTLLEDADHVICVGAGEYEIARTRLGHDRVSHLPNGVDPEKFRHGDGAAFRKKLGIPSDAALILQLSRIDAQKNQMLLLEAFARLLKSQPNTILLLIGPETQPDYARRLREFAGAHGLGTSVKILPGLRHDDPDLVNALHACDLFVLPSVHEPFGIVVLEAWCCRKPIVAARIGGLKDLIRDGDTGLFFDPASGEAELCAILDRLLRDPALRTRLGEAGFNEVGSHYTWQQVCRKLESIYACAEEYSRSRGKP